MYPNDIDKFIVKLNKKHDGSLYVIEEKISICNGVFEGLLSHDNINTNSIHVYTGSKLTGEEVKNVAISVPGNTPWKREIKVFSNAQTVYITYETPGDTVEAEDINNLQDCIEATQKEMERYKTEGHVDGGTF